MTGDVTRVGEARLWFGVAAAPGAWLLNEAVGYVVASRLCEPTLGSSGAVSAGTARVTNIVICTICLLVALAGLRVALGNWRTLRGATNRSTHATFLSIGGTFSSAVFAVAIAMFGMPALIVNVCVKAH